MVGYFRLEDMCGHPLDFVGLVWQAGMGTEEAIGADGCSRRGEHK